MVTRPCLRGLARFFFIFSTEWLLLMAPVIKCLAAGVAIALLSSPAPATDFKCGKNFITLQIEGSENSPPKIITVPRKNFLVVMVMDKLAAFRMKYTEYDDLDDEDLAGLLHAMYYSDFSVEQYTKMINSRVAYVKIGQAEQSITMDTSRRLIEYLD